MAIETPPQSASTSAGTNTHPIWAGSDGSAANASPRALSPSGDSQDPTKSLESQASDAQKQADLLAADLRDRIPNLAPMRADIAKLQAWFERCAHIESEADRRRSASKAGSEQADPSGGGGLTTALGTVSGAYMPELPLVEADLAIGEDLMEAFQKATDQIDCLLGHVDDCESVPDAQQLIAGLWEQVSTLQRVHNRVTMGCEALRSRFTSLVYATQSTQTLAHNLVSSVHHRASRQEADAYVAMIDRHVMDLDKSNPTEADILSHDASRAISLMYELARNFDNIRRVVEQERRRVRLTEIIVTSYALTAFAIAVVAVWFASSRGIAQAPIGESSLSRDYLLPYVGVPWPVIIWAGIGSFAAVLHRFNYNPSWDVTEALKWIVTRPILGIFLGAAVYLVVRSGLDILGTGGSSSGSAADIAILLLCFLVGFSDRVKDSVFNNLVQRYPQNHDGPGGHAKES